jgi:hypothetical protein
MSYIDALEMINAQKRYLNLIVLLIHHTMLTNTNRIQVIQRTQPMTIDIIPNNDALPENDETVTLTVTNAYANLLYPFTASGSGTVTIKDDDKWKIDLSGEEDAEDGITLYEEGTTSTIYTLTRVDDGANRYGDLTYAINVTLGLSGTASPSDYNIFVGASTQSLSHSNSVVTVTIPAGSESVDVKFKAVDDNIIERLEESLMITMVSAVNGSIQYAIDDEFFEISFVDNDKLDLQKVVFTNNLTNFMSDPDSNGNAIAWGNGPHWVKNQQLNRDYTSGYVPVAYSSQEELCARGKWKVLAGQSIDPAIANDLYVYFEVNINGVRQSDKIKLIPSPSDNSWVLDNVSARLAQTFAALQGQKAVYNPGFQLNWKFYVGTEGSTKSRDAGESTSCLYVTYDTPQTTNLYHSVVHIGTVAANGVTAATTGNADQPIFDAIWAKFSGNNICLYSVVIENGAVNDSKSGNELYYYGIVDTASSFGLTVARTNNVSNVLGLLQYKDGCCGAWSSFLVGILTAQGLQANQTYVAGLMGPFDRSGQKAYHKFLCADSSIGKHHNQIPLENKWINHWIVKYNGLYYDSSYGISYSGIVEIIQSFSYDYQLSDKNNGVMQNRPGTEYDPTIHRTPWVNLSDH